MTYIFASALSGSSHSCLFVVMVTSLHTNIITLRVIAISVEGIFGFVVLSWVMIRVRVQRVCHSSVR